MRSHDHAKNRPIQTNSPPKNRPIQTNSPPKKHTPQKTQAQLRHPQNTGQFRQPATPPPQKTNNSQYPNRRAGNGPFWHRAVITKNGHSGRCCFCGPLGGALRPTAPDCAPLRPLRPTGATGRVLQPGMPEKRINKKKYKMGKKYFILFFYRYSYTE